MSEHVHVTLVLQQSVHGSAKDIKVTLRWLEASGNERIPAQASQKVSRRRVRSVVANSDMSNIFYCWSDKPYGCYDISW